MEWITWDAAVVVLIVLVAVGYLLRRFTLPGTRCGCGSNCGSCGGNSYRDNKEEKVCQCQVLKEGKGKDSQE